jgi:N6-adenosine-specific RNA methylase IME4
MTGRNLPAVPKPGSAISAKRVGEIELQVWEAAPGCDDVDALKAIERKLAGWVAELRAPEMQRPLLGAQRRVEAEIGKLLGPAMVGQSNPHHDEVSHDQDRADFRLLARAIDELGLSPEAFRKSRRALTKDIRFQLGLMPETPPLPDGQFRCIVADPPWKMDTGPDVIGGTVESGHDALAYDQMTVEDIKGLDVEGRAADDAHLYLWTTNRYVEAAYDVARAWGFKPSVLLVWAKKPQGVGLGDTYRLTTEFVLFARRGNLEHRQIIPRSWFDWPRGKHSVKPAGFFEMVESVTPGPERLEMFARAKREGWTVWGAEA